MGRRSLAGRGTSGSGSGNGNPEATSAEVGAVAYGADVLGRVQVVVLALGRPGGLGQPRT